MGNGQWWAMGNDDVPFPQDTALNPANPLGMDIDGAGPTSSIEQTLPYSKLILTDLEGHTEDPNNEKSAALHREIDNHVAILKHGGAQGPYHGISGLPSTAAFKDYSQIGEFEIGLAYWGSPHWSDNADHDTLGMPTSDVFKTNAWESMRWISRNSLNCITFGEKYKVEFWPPQWKEKGEKESLPKGRQLIVDEGYFRAYEPMASGGALEPLQHAGQPTYVAMLVPQRFRECLCYTGDQTIDFGRTCLAVLNKLAPMERAVELGGQTYSLSFEIHLAKLEQEQSASSRSF